MMLFSLQTRDRYAVLQTGLGYAPFDHGGRSLYRQATAMLLYSYVIRAMSFIYRLSQCGLKALQDSTTFKVSSDDPYLYRAFIVNDIKCQHS